LVKGSSLRNAATRQTLACAEAVRDCPTTQIAQSIAAICLRPSIAIADQLLDIRDCLTL
jgi:hypothetical protein